MLMTKHVRAFDRDCHFTRVMSSSPGSLLEFARPRESRSEAPVCTSEATIEIANSSNNLTSKALFRNDLAAAQKTRHNRNVSFVASAAIRIGGLHVRQAKGFRAGVDADSDQH